MNQESIKNQNANSEPSLSSKSTADGTSGPWLIAKVAGGLYAIPAMFVQTMVVCPEVTAIPNTPAFTRGVINLRGQVMPLIDLRKRLNLKSIREDKDKLCSLLEAREEDHKKWLTELELSIKENRQFNLATDPHKCAFGRWYDTFQTDDLTFSFMLKKFEEPHKAIHGIAATAQKLQQDGNEAGAMHVIEEARQTTLAVMIHLFEETKALIRQSTREIVVVLEQDNRHVAITVDKLDAVEALSVENIEPLPVSLGANVPLLVKATGKRNGGELVLFLDIDQLFDNGNIKVAHL